MERILADHDVAERLPGEGVEIIHTCIREMREAGVGHPRDLAVGTQGHVVGVRFRVDQRDLAGVEVDDAHARVASLVRSVTVNHNSRPSGLIERSCWARPTLSGGPTFHAGP